jgi:Na+-transporting NADH:ubiquinone oxidoreductase subunit A
VTKNNSSTIHIRRGLNLPLTGQPDQAITAGAGTRSVALQGADYLGLKPRMLVEQGQHVAAGQPLFVDKRDQQVSFTAPVSGTVMMINRGARRALQSVVIEMDEAQPLCDDYRGLADQDLASLSAAEITAPLYKSGLWTAFRTRPYSKVPLSGSRPAAIFVTAIDTQPLAADPAVIINEYADAFEQGLRVIARLSDGSVFLCTASDWQGPQVAGVQHAEFTGPHPAGLPGTHIHHLHPASVENTVWHIGYQDVIAIGMLFAEGRLWTERVIALGGQGFKQPRLVTTRLGASIEELVAGELQSDTPARIVSGSVLNGRVAEGADAYLGRYHLQVTTVPKLRRRRLFGWLRSGAYSYAGLLSPRNPRPAGQLLTTAQYGRPTAMLPIDAFDKVMPLDLLPVPLLKALLIQDTDQAQLLGCLELAPEDLALCSFVCPGKNDYGAVLLENLKQIERDG